MPVLRSRLDERAVHARTGCLLHWSYLPVKLLWLQQAEPGAYARTRHWVSFGELLHLRLLGRAACGVSMASGTGLFDQNEQHWDPEVLGAVDLDEGRLLPLVGQGEALDGLPTHTQVAGQRCGRRAGSRPWATVPSATSAAAA